MHVVRKGQCLSVIAARYGLHWPDIAQRSGVDGPEYVIYPGQVLALG